MRYFLHYYIYNSISAFIILHIFIDLILGLVLELDTRTYNSVSANLAQKKYLFLMKEVNLIIVKRNRK